MQNKTPIVANDVIYSANSRENVESFILFTAARKYLLFVCRNGNYYWAEFENDNQLIDALRAVFLVKETREGLVFVSARGSYTLPPMPAALIDQVKEIMRLCSQLR